MSVLTWVGGNYTALLLGASALEQFPFPDLSLVSTVGALLIAMLILTTQSHQDQLAERRAQLTLQIALLSEKKVAKIIALLEEQRRENPMLASRVDEEAETMAHSLDPAESLRSIDRSRVSNESDPARV